MDLKGVSIYDAKITKVNHSSTSFSGNTATVNMIHVHFNSSKYSDKFTGNISLDRKNARLLIRKLQSELKVRSSKNYLRWQNIKRSTKVSKKIKPPKPLQQ